MVISKKVPVRESEPFKLVTPPMYRIFKILITAHPKALFSMFFVAFFASFGVLAIQELVVNVEQSVARETRPLLGGDIAIEARNSFTGSLREAIESKLSDVESLKFSEKVNLETTLFDREGKTGLVKLVIVDPVYPLRSVFEITTFS